MMTLYVSLLTSMAAGYTALVITESLYEAVDSQETNAKSYDSFLVVNIVLNILYPLLDCLILFTLMRFDSAGAHMVDEIRQSLIESFVETDVETAEREAFDRR